jgi:serine/threonine protein kinase
MLAKDPKNRYSAKECIEHKFFSKLNKKADRINKNAGKNLLRG